MSRFLELAAATLLIASPALGDGLGLGRPATPAEIEAWDIDIRPDGQGLPEGRGTVAMGEEVFTDQCAVCHGDFGEAVDRWPVIAGGQGSLDSEDPVKTVGSYWPYTSTVWDYVHRAMPFGNAQSLSDDEVYAITAYILYLNDLVDDEEFELSHENFAEVRLPNEEGFFMDDRAEMELASLSEAPCMENCKESVEITMRARVLDVTPESEDDAATAEPVAETVVAAAAPDPALVEAGEGVFRQCMACHQVGDGAKNRSGPILNGILGRAAGTVEGFRYSRPLLEAAENGLVWTPETMAEFLANPRTYIRGTRMSFRGISDADDMEALIAYLSTFEQ